MKRQAKRSKISIRRVLCVLMLIVGISTFSSMRANATTVSYDLPSYSSLTPHDSISITSDIDFGVFPGLGTEEDPYVIEGYNITTTSTNGIITASTKGIYITDTTKYFIIRNCLVDADYGIYIDDVADGTTTVINNTCSNNNYGISLFYSGNSTVANNTCSNNNNLGIWLWYSGSSTVANNMCNNNGHGIYLLDSGCSTVTNNTCSNNGWGISFRFSNSSTVANNMCNNNDYDGIELEDSSSSTVANNTCNNNYWGISLSSSGSSTVANNTFTDCGLCINENTLDAYLSYTLENNWVNGKKLGFYTNLDSTIIDEPVYGQLILVNCTNVIVRDQILNSATAGLSLYSCTYSVVINNTCSNNDDDGINLRYSGSSTIVNNTCNSNWVGIALEYSGSSAVENNTCTSNKMGISLYHSWSSTATKNTCNNNWEGISLSSSSSATVTNNTCNNNIKCGIHLSSSDSSTIANNTCSNNNYGIILYGSGFCVVTYNLLQGNEVYGIYLHDIYLGYYYVGYHYIYSDNNLIHHNNFVDNNLGGTSQAYDSGSNNFWYDTVTQEGNYWSDWSGTGNYSIDGDESSIDLYPLDEPVEYSTDETQILFTLTLLIVVVPLILIKLFSRKRR